MFPDSIILIEILILCSSACKFYSFLNSISTYVSNNSQKIIYIIRSIRNSQQDYK